MRRCKVGRLPCVLAVTCMVSAGRPPCALQARLSVAGAQVVIFAVPGAFTPTCSLKHLPGFIEKADELKAKGVETIACVAVNDAFVMDAWGKSVDAGDKVMLLADGSALFTKARPPVPLLQLPALSYTRAPVAAC